MKNKQYKSHCAEQRKRKSLNYLAAEGKREVVWSLHPNEVLELAETYKIIPDVYKIRTRKFSNIRQIKNPILKELHYSYKAGKDFIRCKLSKKDLQILHEYGISVKAVKFRIVLR